MSRIAWWLTRAITYPLSLLPFGILFFFSDILFVLVFYVARYRRKVVAGNLRNSFPDKTEAELQSIAKKFYRNFCDIIVENMKLPSLSREDVEKRCVVRNRELLDNYFKQGKSVIATIGHCGNWEMAGLGISLAVQHRPIVFYRPLKNVYFDRFMKNLRSRFGMYLLPHTQARQMLKEQGKQPNLYIFITDQTPSNTTTAHWTTFLNQDTPVFKGTEKFARLTGLPVVYGDIQRVKRGYYSIDVSFLLENPEGTREGEITAIHTKALEDAIMRHAHNWLWSHRRWKRKRM